MENEGMLERWLSACPLDYEQVNKAVKALMQYVSKPKEGKTRLFDRNVAIQMVILLHKVPRLRDKPLFLKIPHSIYPKGTEICLITRNICGTDCVERTVSSFQKRLTKQGIDCVTKIMPLKELQLECKDYESKKRLLFSYDLFICEECIYHMMSRLLGPAFRKFKKDPWVIRLNDNYMKVEFDRRLNSTRWLMTGRGSTSTVKVARTDFSSTQIVENIMDSSIHLARLAPRGWSNIRSISIRTEQSLALPIYFKDLPGDIDGFDMMELRFLTKQKKKEIERKKILNLIGSKNVTKKSNGT